MSDWPQVILVVGQFELCANKKDSLMESLDDTRVLLGRSRKRIRIRDDLTICQLY